MIIVKKNNRNFQKTPQDIKLSVEKSLQTVEIILQRKNATNFSAFFLQLMNNFCTGTHVYTFMAV